MELSDGQPCFAGAIASSGDPATAAMEQRPGLASSTAAGPANARNMIPEWKDPALQELPPLSHFSEDVRDQIKAILSASGRSNSSEEGDCMANEFSDVNAVEDSDSESELSDSMEDIAMSLFGTVNLDKILADLEGKDSTLEVQGTASEYSNISDGEDSDSESELSDSVEDTAMSLFGTFDLDEILADLSRPEAGVVFFQPPVPAEAHVTCNSARKQADQPHDTVPSDGESEQPALKDSSKLLVKNIFVAEQDLTAIWECRATAYVNSCLVVQRLSWPSANLQRGQHHQLEHACLLQVFMEVVWRVLLYHPSK